MKTITFYSYKGGVGRSLLVANAARYLSILGKNVFAIDLDLEAPGLHYKFELDPSDVPKTPEAGLIDVLINFFESEKCPDDLGPYVAELDTPAGAGQIRLMWSGEAPLGMYWRKLAEVDWHELLYGSNHIGFSFFKALKAQIERQYNPDFLLIDARTGVTEMGGIATTLLPDVVVALALATREHLEGLRAVMHGIRHARAEQEPSAPIQIVPVISRLPLSSDSSFDDDIAARTREFLNEPFGKALESLGVSEIAVLHTEPLLDNAERVLVGGRSGPHEIPLLRDYLRLFSRIIPAEDLRPHIGSLIQNAVSRILDDHAGAQSSLEELTTYCGDQAAYRALLKLYRVTKTPLDKTLMVADTMWRLGVQPDDPLLVEIVKVGFSELRAVDVQKKYAEFGEAVWRASGGKDVRVALMLVSSFLPERRDRALKVLREHIERADPPSPNVLARLIELLRTSGAPRDEALDLVSRFKGSAAISPEFLVAWARLVLDLDDAGPAQRLLEDPLFRVEALRAADLVVYYRLRQRFADPAPSSVLLLELADELIANNNLSQLAQLAELSEEEGRLNELLAHIRSRAPAHVLDEVMNRARLGGRRHSPPLRRRS